MKLQDVLKHAKATRKKGESWPDAQERAKKELSSGVTPAESKKKPSKKSEGPAFRPFVQGRFR